MTHSLELWQPSSQLGGQSKELEGGNPAVGVQVEEGPTEMAPVVSGGQLGQGGGEGAGDGACSRGEVDDCSRKFLSPGGHHL